MFKGKAIYNPSGKAGEYSYWACNFYVGCSNGCEYCYCKKGVLANAMGQDKPQLKSCFKDKIDAINRFKIELGRNLLWEGKASSLYSHGIFFSFTTDPMLPETIELTLDAVYECMEKDIPVKILTKSTLCIDWFIHECNKYCFDNSKIAFGVTITGHDELESGASTNEERIITLKKLHHFGFKTWASIEPIIHIQSSSDMIRKTEGFCDLYKIGLLSGKKFDKILLNDFVNYINAFCSNTPIYWKDTLLKQAGISRDELPKNCISRDFSLFILVVDCPFSLRHGNTSSNH